VNQLAASFNHPLKMRAYQQETEAQRL